jgi:hypothetical protein
MERNIDDNLPDVSLAREHDQRLIHALLLHLHDGNAVQNRELRVQRAMQAIRDTSDEGLKTHPRHIRLFPVWMRRVAWAAAAVFLIAAGLWFFSSSPAPAMASLNDILSALGRPGDRTYHIHMVDQPEPPKRRPPGESPKENVPRPGLDEATLYLRDGLQYLLVRRDPHGGKILDGYDGRKSWRIRNGKLEEIREGLGAGGIPMPPIMADVPFSDLHKTLERIRLDYTVRQFDFSPLPPGEASLRHVLVRRNSALVKGPETIEIWADPRTAMPKRIIFDRAKIQGNEQPCRLTFDLTSEETLSPDWFRPAPHLD